MWSPKHDNAILTTTVRPVQHKLDIIPMTRRLLKSTLHYIQLVYSDLYRAFRIFLQCCQTGLSFTSHF